MARTPTYSPHLRVQCAGVFGPAGSAWEIFSYGFSIGQASGQGPAVGGTVLADLCDDVQEFHAGAGAHIANAARLTSIKVALVNPDGSWNGAQAAYERSCDVPGGINVGASCPAPQSALAVTLRSNVNTPRTRGRFFLPMVALNPSVTDGLIAEQAATEVASAVESLITNVNNQPGFDQNGDQVIVASTFGTNSVVTSVSVGRVIDTIRSRRNALQESYVSRPIP
jgi:hypothetical protein